MTRARFHHTAPQSGSPLSLWTGSGQPVSGPLRVDPAAVNTPSPLALTARPWPPQAIYDWRGLDDLTVGLRSASPRMGDGSDPCSINCATPEIQPLGEEALTDETTDLLRASIAPASARALRGDLDQFAAWGGTLPATSALIARYIADHAGQHAVATIQRRLASISKAHEMAGLHNPCRTEIVKATLRGLRRVKGTAQRQAKPQLRDDLFLVLDALGDRLRDQRDRALFLLGFAGGFRRSELVALNVADIQAVREGLVITIRRSKTDQEGAGLRIGIPHGRTRHCPVRAVEGWLCIAGIDAGPVFRPITRHGVLATSRLTGDAVSILIRERIAAAGMAPEGFSGHSQRAGFATSAAQAGASGAKIRAQTGHASEAMLSRYIRNGDLFTGNAVGVVL